MLGFLKSVVKWTNNKIKYSQIMIYFVMIKVKTIESYKQKGDAHFNYLNECLQHEFKNYKLKA